MSPGLLPLANRRFQGRPFSPPLSCPSAICHRKPLTPDELNRQLLEAGLLSQIPPCPDPATYQEFSPIVIRGEPLSQTIIRERR